MENFEQFKLTPPESAPKRRGKGHEPITPKELDEYVEKEFGGHRLSEERNQAAAKEAFEKVKKILSDKEKE